MDAKRIISVNKKDRETYVELWARYVRDHKDSVWGKQQDMFINSLMKNAKQSRISAKEYLAIKNGIKN